MMLQLLLRLHTIQSLPAPEFASQLSPSSQKRYQSLGTDRRRNQFLWGRWLIAQSANCNLDEIIEGENYPILCQHQDWHASISHSGQYIAVLLSQHGRFGLDIEEVTRERDWLALAQRAFHPAELAWLKTLPAHEHAQGFTWLWTLREASYKAGLRDDVVGGEQIYDSHENRVLGGLYWKSLQQKSCHISVVGPETFSLKLIQQD